MVNLTIKVQSREWDDFIRHIDDKVKEPTKLLRSVFNVWGFKDIVDHFEKQEGPDGAWPQRKTETNEIYDRIKNGFRKPPKGMPAGAFSSSNRLLQLQGNLRKSVLQPNMGVADRGRYSIMVFSNNVYAGAHNSGYKGIPKREFMWISDSATERMAETILSIVMGEGK